jgi:hypothetical protein
VTGPYRKPKRVAAVAALGGLLFGYDTGVISGAVLFIRKVMDLSPTTEGIVVATAGQLSGRVGRRTVILGAVRCGCRRLRRRSGRRDPADRPPYCQTRDRGRLDADAALPCRDLQGPRPRGDSIAQLALHYGRHPRFLSD